MKIGGYHDRCLGESLTDIAESPVKGQVLQTRTALFSSCAVVGTRHRLCDLPGTKAS
jgi:hypothetical protein